MTASTSAHVAGVRVAQGVPIDVDLSCPHCHQIDLVQSVPAVYTDGISSSFGTGTYSGVGVASTGLVPVIGTASIDRTHVTMLARSLAPEPAQESATRLTIVGLLLLIPAFCIAIPMAISTAMGDPAMSLATWVVCLLFFIGPAAAPGLVTIGVAVGRARANKRIVRGRPKAHAVWQAGVYCHRCGLVFWPVSPAADIPPRQPFRPKQFRSLVWKVGGFVKT
ncbi:hypothetical protein IU510_20575 [Nocardia cyriacigeorgica]|uniref:hypothetical protein n=1 Tax=Nocardia cyriacigeorgica TaxID=135487 RepID=UPI001894D8AE|nr:hypothetical protein [Nocardia cyriacigeorgica]MBF6100457.1 hypothetical protein [Nocardia cyriacigeorgica]MBF6320291.1 hypothetical protein [Nocardia cyriacigeorgica]MBF6346333.1 hypothetical protein [Nocardia cyriacigeorgica]MBF6534223.1 hypothetical protein [Nocardia cyriacigeorgica]